MLPPQLSEDLCSLQPHQERLTFSAFFTLDKDANVLSTDFSRTIIKSCARLSYADAKAVLDGTPLSHDKVEGHPQSVVESGIKDLHVSGSRTMLGVMLMARRSLASYVRRELIMGL